MRVGHEFVRPIIRLAVAVFEHFLDFGFLCGCALRVIGMLFVRHECKIGTMNDTNEPNTEIENAEAVADALAEWWHASRVTCHGVSAALLRGACLSPK